VRLSCPQCGVALTDQQVNVALGVAACGACGAVSDLAPQARAAAPAVQRSPGDATGLEVADGPAPQVSWSHGFIGPVVLVFCVVWNGTLGTMMSSVVEDQGTAGLVLFVPFLISGLGMGYYGLALTLNRTTLSVGPERVELTHRPLPMFGQASIPARSIREVHVREVFGKKNSRSYAVHAVLDDGRSVRVVGSVTTRERARFLEDWLQAKLGLVDRPVAGETR
jgi:hypothetical protein